MHHVEMLKTSVLDLPILNLQALVYSSKIAQIYHSYQEWPCVHLVQYCIILQVNKHLTSNRNGRPSRWDKSHVHFTTNAN